MPSTGFREDYEKQIRDKVKKTKNRDLTEFEKRVNAAAGELCLNDKTERGC